LTTFIDIVFSLFFLVPGFVIVRIHQTTREFRDLSAFEYTTLSIAQSFLVLVLWILWILLIDSIFRFHLIDNLKELMLLGKHGLFFSPSLAVFFVTSLTAFIVAALFFFNLAWTRLLNKGLRAIGFNRFTEHLTPWEDFQILGQPHWILVEFKDGKSISGKLAFGSHMPFERELVLKRVDQSPVTVYDKDHRIVSYGPDIDMTYINADEIQNIHMIRDKAEEERIHPPTNYVQMAFSLGISTLLIAFFMMLFALRLDGSYPNWPFWIQYFFPVALLAVFWNPRSLARYS
jgi:hypothetical protein